MSHLPVYNPHRIRCLEEHEFDGAILCPICDFAEIFLKMRKCLLASL